MHVYLKWLLLMLVPNLAFPEVVYRIGTNTSLVESRPDLIQKIKRAWNLAGYEIEWVNMPAARSLDRVSKGEFDGEAVRVSIEVDGIYSLEPVPVPITREGFWVFVHESRKCFDLKELQYMKPVGIKGYGIYDAVYKMSKVGFEEVREVDKLFSMLASGRADYSVGPKMAAEVQAALTGISLKPCFNRPLYTFETFTYLHPKNIHLIPELTKSYEAVFSEEMD